MNKNIEKEFKILVDENKFKQLLKSMNNPTFITQVNIYYDTINHDIEKLRGAMRIRTIENKHIFTLKMHDKEDLLEYECELDENNIQALNNPDVHSLLSQFNICPPYIKKATLKTKRAVIVDDDAELCFDINYYNDIVDYEIEYEFKRDHDGLTKFNQILRKINLNYENNCKSKIARALNK